MHPKALEFLPAGDVGAELRGRYPWLGDVDVWFAEPREVAPDLDAINAVIGDVRLGTILVFRLLRPASDDDQDVRLVFRAVPLGEQDAA